MKTSMLLPIVLFAACAAPPSRPEIPPLRLPPPRREAPAPAPERTPTDEAATQHWLEQTQPQHPAAAPRTPTDEAATQQWLEREIEHQNTVNPRHEPEPIYQVVEKPVYVDRPYSGGGYDSSGQPVYGPYPGNHRPDTFPMNTLAGAGVGYLIGGHHNHDQGAAIGAGIGLLFDLGNWLR